MQRLGASGSSIFRTLAVPNLKRKASNSWSAVQDTYISTKDIFERHRVVFTISTSILSASAAWFGYSLRYVHQSKVEMKLESIEQAMKIRHLEEDEEIKKIIRGGNVSFPTCVATAGISCLIGYCLGWRGGRWYANKKFQREQLKLLGQIKPQRWQFLKKPLLRYKMSRTHLKTSETLRKPDTAAITSQPIQHAS
ncbi:hypothetical protein H6P81_008006 [Aristolochia fimbriata]|uniref:Uncharacterized protein n=1 Tax=Aristolochia fimbriata TaxID=158543 RepID=A0AAV7F5N4_ARIFI|nr:hypothetical protein H6P81_008006 [Aristolochia fimbriata]